MSHNTHLVVLSEDFWPTVSGGAHEQWRFAQLAAERGYEVTVFTKRPQGTGRAERVDGVEIRRPLPAQPRRLPPNHPIAFLTRVGFSVCLFVVTAFWVRRRDPDLIVSVSHLFHWVGAAVSKLHGIRLVSYIGYTPSLKSSFRVHPEFVLERVNFAWFLGEPVFCRAPRVRSVLERHNDDVRLIHGILNNDRVEAAHEALGRNGDRGPFPDEQSEVLAFVGRLTPLKRPLAAIDVVSRLPDRFKLVVVGDGPLRETVEQAIRTSGDPDRIRCLGALPHDETLETIAAADGLLLTSRAEAYPTVVFEALAFQKPVFATPVGVLPEICEPRLHTAPTEDLPEVVIDHIDQSGQALDTEILARYSMRRYAESMLACVGEPDDRT